MGGSSTRSYAALRKSVGSSSTEDLQRKASQPAVCETPRCCISNSDPLQIVVGRLRSLSLGLVGRVALPGDEMSAAVFDYDSCESARHKGEHLSNLISAGVVPAGGVDGHVHFTC